MIPVAAAFVVAVVALAVFWPASPPPEPLGLPADHLQSYAVSAAAFPESFQVEDDAAGEINARKNVRLWTICRQYKSKFKNPGEDFTCGPQQTGDCVS